MSSRTRSRSGRRARTTLFVPTAAYWKRRGRTVSILRIDITAGRPRSASCSCRSFNDTGTCAHVWEATLAIARARQK